MMKKLRRILSAVCAFALSVSAMGVEFTASADFDPNSATSTDIIFDMGIGWNLGNSLECNNNYTINSEVNWGNPKVTKELIDKVAEAGFKTVRVPVSWSNHVTDSNYTIDTAWLARVKEVVDYCRDDGLYVIINIHHDNAENTSNKYFPNSAGLETGKKIVSSYWTQIANYFSEYDDHLVFETLNEPRLVDKGTNLEWWGEWAGYNDTIIDAMNCVNELNQTAVDAIRSTDTNKDRLIMCPGYAACADGALSDYYKLPTDISGNTNRLVVSIHAYSPYEFAMNAYGTTTYDSNIQSQLTSLINSISTKFTSKGIPVVIGEFGATYKANSAERVKWANDFTSLAKQNNIMLCAWDNNVFTQSGGSETFGIINRSTLGYYDTDYVNALTAPYNGGSTVPTNPTTTTTTTTTASPSDSTDTKVIVPTKDSSGYYVVNVSGATYITVTVKGTTGQTANGCIGWSSTQSDWNQSEFSVSSMPSSGYVFDFTVPDGVTSVQIQNWWPETATVESVVLHYPVSETTTTTTASNTTTTTTPKPTTTTTTTSKATTTTTTTPKPTTTTTTTPKATTTTTTTPKPTTTTTTTPKPTITTTTTPKPTTTTTTTSKATTTTTTSPKPTTTTTTTPKPTTTTTAPQTTTSKVTTTTSPAEEKLSIKNASIGSISAKTYTGSKITPIISAMYSKTVLVLGKDYTVSYSNNTNAGTARVTINGIGKYCDTVTKTFVISAKSITKTATLSGVTSKVYNGKAQTQNVTVKVGTKTLVKNVDYTVSYSSNTKVGKARLVVRGKGNYSGAVVKYFNINPRKQTLKSVTSGKKSFRAKWTKMTEATGYQLEYSTSSKFTSYTSKWITSRTQYARTISDLSSKKTYYVRVRTYTKIGSSKYYGTWSAVKKITTT